MVRNGGGWRRMDHGPRGEGCFVRVYPRLFRYFRVLVVAGAKNKKNNFFL